MATTPDDNQPDHEPDVDELPEEQNGSADLASDDPKPEDDVEAMEEAQEEGAEQREEGGYH